MALAGAAGCEMLGPHDRWVSLGLEHVRVTHVTQTSWGLFAVSDSGVVYRLENDGQWREMARFEGPRRTARGPVSALLEAGTDVPRLLIGLLIPVALHGASDSVAIYSSLDGGSTWVPSADTFSGRRAYSMAVDPHNADRVFWGMVSSVARSDDGGTTWRVSGYSSGSIANGVVALRGDAVRPGWIWLVQHGPFEGGGVCASHDAGESWACRTSRWLGEVLPDPFSGSRVWLASRWLIRFDAESQMWVPLDTLSWGVSSFVQKNDAVFGIGGKDGRLRVGLLEDDGWRQIDAPRAAAGGISGTFDAEGRLVVGTTSGVWRREND